MTMAISSTFIPNCLWASSNFSIIHAALGLSSLGKDMCRSNVLRTFTLGVRIAEAFGHLYHNIQLLSSKLAKFCRNYGSSYNSVSPKKAVVPVLVSTRCLNFRSEKSISFEDDEGIISCVMFSMDIALSIKPEKRSCKTSYFSPEDSSLR